MIYFQGSDLGCILAILVCMSAPFVIPALCWLHEKLFDKRGK